MSSEDGGPKKSSSRKRSHSCMEVVYLKSNTWMTISQLARRFVSQLSVDEISNELSLQIIKNLVYVAKVLCLLKTSTADAASAVEDANSPNADGEDDAAADDDDNDDKDVAAVSSKPVDLAWLIRKMVRIAKYEAGHNQRQSAKVS